MFQCIMTGTNHESYGKVSDFLKVAKEQGVESLAIMDRNSTASSIQFINGCKKNNIKPIIGVTNAIDYPLLDNLNFIEKNSSLFIKLSGLIENNKSEINIDSILNKEENDIIKFIDIFKELKEDYNFFNRSKSKTKNTIFFDKLKEKLSVIGFNLSAIKNTDEFILSISDYFKALDMDNDFKDLRLIALNEEGIIHINELITHAYKDGQSKLPLETTSGKRKPNSHPLMHIDEVTKKIDNLIALSFNMDKDFLSDIKNSIIKERVLNDIKNRFENNLMFALTNNVVLKDADYKFKQQKTTSILTLSAKFDIPVLATQFSKMPKKDDLKIANLKSMFQEGLISYLPNNKKRIYDGEYLISNDKLKENFKDFPNAVFSNNEDLLSIIDTKMLLGKNYLPVAPISEEFTRKVYKEIYPNYGLVFNEKEPVEVLTENLRTVINNKLKEKFSGKELELETGKELSNILSNPYLENVAWEGTLRNLKKDFPNNWQEKVDEYKARFDYEFDIISGMGFSGYFLIVYDIIKYAKENNIPVGAGRGSGAASIIAYALKITNLDPIKYDLFFERFLNPERISMPDFDIDIGSESRDKLIDYIKVTYGDDMVSQIGTIGVFKPKSAITSLLTVMGYTVPRKIAVSKIIPEDPSLKLSDLDHNEEFQEMLSRDNILAEIFELAKKIEGEVNTSGIHAGGVAIAPNTSLTKFSPIVRDSSGNAATTQFDKNDVEYAGLVKFDFLGLNNLDVMLTAILQIKENYNINIDIDNVNVDDPKTYELLKTAKTQDVFQLSSPGIKKLVKDLQVDNLEDISALVALYRPGPMQSGMMDSYVNRRKGIEEVKYIHPNAKQITEQTYGTVVYQEQVMKIAEDVANYTKGEGDLLRRAMGKKKPEEMEAQKSKFISGALLLNNKDRQKEIKNINNLDINLVLNDIPLVKGFVNEDGFFSEANLLQNFLVNKIGVNVDKFTALVSASNDTNMNLEKLIQDYKYDIFPYILKSLEEDNETKDLSPEVNKLNASRIYYNIFEHIRYVNVFNVIEKFAGYGFNKAHSLAYGFIAYQTAYLKANYPKEFFAGVLTGQNDIEKLYPTVSDMENNFNIKLEKPSINQSCYIYKSRADSDVVIAGLKNIKGVGKYGLIIENERKINGEYTNLTDLLLRVAYRNEIDKTTNNSKLSSGAFKGLLYSGALDCFINDDFKNRNYLFEEFNKFKYPDNISEEVENRIKTGSYSNDIYIGEPNFNLFQNLVVKIIANGKNLKDILFNDEELDNFKESLKVKAPKNKDEDSDPDGESENNPSENIESDNIVENDDSDDVVVTKPKRKKEVIVDSKVIEEKNAGLVKYLSKFGYTKDDFDNLTFINEVDKKTFDKYLKLLKTKTRYSRTEKQIKDVEELEKELINNIPKDHMENLKLITKKLNPFSDNVFTTIEMIINSENHFKNIDIPLSLYLFQDMYDHKEMKSRDRAMFFIKELKDTYPQILNKVKDKVKRFIVADDMFFLALEKDLTGVYMSMHPTDINNAHDNYKETKTLLLTLREINDILENNELAQEYIGKSVNSVAIFNDVRLTKTRAKGEDMAILNISDKTDSVDLACFSQLYANIKEHLEVGNVAGIEIKFGEQTMKQQDGSETKRVSLSLNAVRFYNPNIIKEITVSDKTQLKQRNN